MLNALGTPQSVLVLGGTSDIGLATIEQLAATGRLLRVVLAGRPSEALTRAGARVEGMGVLTVTLVAFDATDPDSHERIVDQAFDAGEIDLVLMAFGQLPDESMTMDPVSAARVVTTNFTGAVSSLTVCSARLRLQGHGVIVVLSSVSAQRPRRSTHLYGATKAGLDAFASGMADRLIGTGVTVVVVRPGFVRTSMTRGLSEPPLSVDPGTVAKAIVGSLRGPSRTIWVPRAMRLVMAGLVALPRPIFRRLPI